MTSLFRPVCAPLWDRMVLPSDSLLEVKRKKLMSSAMMTLVLACVIGTPALRRNAIKEGCWAAGICLGCCALMWMLVTRSCSERFILTVLSTFTCLVLTLDFNSLASLDPDREWSLLVLVADLLLVLEVRISAALGVLAVTLTWLTITASEMAFRWGLLDVGGTLSYAERSEVCSCAQPPCPASSNVLGNWLSAVSVFALDFYFTRGFSSQWTAAREKAQVSVAAARQVAAAMAAFDLDTSELVLDAAVEMDSDLADALRLLLSNLKSYRPYLPPTCLPEQGMSQSDEDSSLATTIVKGAASTPDSPALSLTQPLHPGGMRQERVSVVVVNLLNSTALIERSVAEFATGHASLLSRAIDVFAAYRGVADGFAGDKIFGSFNASRPCQCHADSALHAAHHLTLTSSHETIPPFTIGVASGKVWCGDLGCESMKRFTVLGRTPLVAAALERLAARLGLGTLCDTGVKTDAGHHHELRLVLRAVVAEKHGEELPLLLWEALRPASSTALSSKDEDWMYELESKTARRWGVYNEAGRLYLKDDTETALAMINRADYHSLVEPAFQDLRDRLMLRQPAPRLHISL